MADSALTLSAVVDQNSIIQSIIKAGNAAPPIKIRVDDAPLGRFSARATEFQKSLGAAQARVLAFTATASQVYTLARAFDALVKTTINVEKSLANINAIFSLSSRQLTSFSNNLFQAANETGQSFKTASEAALQFARQGLTVEETLKRTKAAMTLVRLGGVDVQEAITTLTTTINAWNTSSLNATTILNKLTAVDTQFAVSLGDLSEALSRVGSTAKDVRVGFDTLIGFITAAKVVTGRDGAVIGNALKSIFQRIERPKVLEELKQLGVLVEDYKGEALSADVVLQNLAKTYDTLSSSQKNQVVQLAAGVFQANQFRAILQDLGKQNSIVARASQASASATDIAARRQAELNKTLAASVNETFNNITNAAAKIGTITVAPLIKNLTTIGNLITKPFTDELGDKQSEGAGAAIGRGILTGLGNYISGPGLALAGIIIGKLSYNFATFATKSITTVVEANSKKFQQQASINQLIESEEGLQVRLNEIQALRISSTQKELLIQQEINKTLLNRTVQANRNEFIRNAVLSGVTQSSLGGIITTQKGPFAINAKGNLASSAEIGVERVAPNFASDPVERAIQREQNAGVPRSQIRVGASPALRSNRNPSGLGVYNTRDEPFGLGQGVSRAVSRGINPQTKGISGVKAPTVQNFAYIPFLTPLIGKIATNLVHSGQGFSLSSELRPAKYTIQKEGFLSSFKKILSDKQLYGDYDFSLSHEPVSDFAFRGMFGLKPRVEGAEKSVRKLGRNVYTLSREGNKSLASSIPYGLNNFELSGSQIKALSSNADFGRFNVNYDLKTGKIRWQDVWDFALHNHERKQVGLGRSAIEFGKYFFNKENFNKLKDKLTYEISNLPGNIPNANYKTLPSRIKSGLKSLVNLSQNINEEGIDEGGSYYSTSKASAFARRLMTAVTSPITFRGQINKRDPNYRVAVERFISGAQSLMKGNPVISHEIQTDPFFGNREFISRKNIGAGIYFAKAIPIPRVVGAEEKGRTFYLGDLMKDKPNLDISNFAEVPNFANYSTPTQIGVPGGFGYTTSEIPLDPELAKKLEQEISALKQEIRQGKYFQSQLAGKASGFGSKYGLTSGSVARIQGRLLKSFFAPPTKPPGGGPTTTSAGPDDPFSGGGATKAIDPTLFNVPTFSKYEAKLKGFLNSLKKGLIDPSTEAATVLEKKFLEGAKKIEGSHPIYVNFTKKVEDSIIKAQQTGQGRLNQRIKEEEAFKAQIQAEKTTASFQKEAAGLNLLNLPFKYAPLRRKAQRLEQGEVFNNRVAALQGQAFFAGPAIDIVGGLAEQAITSNARGPLGRGFGRLAGGAANVLSYGTTGFGVAGPVGGAVGLGFGVASELPSILKAFSDTLPDLEERLNKVKESTQKTNSGLNDFIQSTQQIADITSGRTHAKGYELRNLRVERANALSQIPIGLRPQLLEAEGKNDLAGVANIASLAQTQNLQLSNSLQDLVNIRTAADKNKPSFLSTLGRTAAADFNVGYNKFGVLGGVSTFAANQFLGRPLSLLGLNLPGVSAANQTYSQNLPKFEGQKDVQRYVGSLLNLVNDKGNPLLNTISKGQINKLNLAGKEGDFDTLINTLGGVLNKNKVPNSEDITQGLKKSFNTPELQDQFKKAFSENFTTSNVEDQRKQNEDYISTTIKTTDSLINFEEKIRRLSDKFEILDRQIATISARNIGAAQLSGTLAELRQKAASERILLSTPTSQRAQTENALNYRGEITRAGSVFKVQNTELTERARQTIGDVISSINKGITDALRKDIEKKSGGELNPGEYQDALDRITNITKFLFDDPKFKELQNKLKSSKSISNSDIEQAKKFLENRITQYEHFRQIGEQLPQNLAELAKSKNISVPEFLKTKEGKDILSQVGADKGVTELLSSNKSPEAQSQIISEGLTQLQETRKGLDELTKFQQTYSSDIQKIAINSENSVQTAKEQLELNRQLIELQERLDKTLSGTRLSNLSGDITTAAKTGRNDVGVGRAFFTSFQYTNNDFYKDALDTVSTFGTDFKSTLAGAFAEAEKSTKNFAQVMRKSFLDLASSYTEKFANQTISAVFSKTLGLIPGVGSIFDKNQGFSRGGFVGMGSGVKDDVPAYLTGGEFVINKKAVQSIGVGNLDRLNKYADGGTVIQPRKYRKPGRNDFAAEVTSDTISGGANSANISLANAYMIGSGLTKGKFDVSKDLSAIGQIDPNNPQNVLKFAREKYVIDNKRRNYQIEIARKNFNKNQDINLTVAGVGAGLRLGIPSLFSPKAPTPGSLESLQNQINAISAAPPPSPTVLGANPFIYGGDANSIEPLPVRGKGGPIPRYAQGGYFGGDTSTDRNPAMLMGGEYVVSPQTVSKYGISYFNSLNNKYAEGGYVNSYASAGSEDLSSYLTQSINVLKEISNKLGSGPSQPNQKSKAASSETAPTIQNTVTINITQSSQSNATATTNPAVSTQGTNSTQTDRDQATKLSQMLQSQVIQILNQQSRPGGVLSERFSTTR